MEEQVQGAQKKGMNMMAIVGVIALVLVVGLGAYGYMQSKKSTTMQEENTQTQPTSAAVTVTTAPSTASANVKEVTMEAGSFYYKPNEITVKKGDSVKITMHAVSMMHNFNIDALNVHSPMVKNGDTATFEFVADKAGTFEYYCSVGQHRQLGQVGKLIVE